MGDGRDAIDSGNANLRGSKSNSIASKIKLVSLVSFTIQEEIDKENSIVVNPFSEKEIEIVYKNLFEKYVERGQIAWLT